MDESVEPISDYIINSLTKMIDRDEIIREVCLRQNIFWEAGESLVNQIETQNKGLLQKHRSPLLFILSMLFASVGLIGSLVVFYALVSTIYTIWKTNGGLIDGALWIYNFWGLFPLLLMSMGMALSGILGLVRAVKGLSRENQEEEM